MSWRVLIYLFCLVGGCCWPGTLGAQGPPHSLAGTAAARKARSCRSAASLQSRSHGKTWPRKPRKRGRRRCGCGLHGRRGPQWGGPWRGSVVSALGVARPQAHAQILFGFCVVVHVVACGLPRFLPIVLDGVRACAGVCAARLFGLFSWVWRHTVLFLWHTHVCMSARGHSRRHLVLRVLCNGQAVMVRGLADHGFMASRRHHRANRSHAVACSLVERVADVVCVCVSHGIGAGRIARVSITRRLWRVGRVRRDRHLSRL